MNRRIVITLAAGAVLLAGCGGGGSGGGGGGGGKAGASSGEAGTAPPAPIAVGEPPPHPSAPPTAKPEPLGPSGYGALKLGMTLAQARATGLITVKSKPGAGCGTFDLKAHPHPADEVGGYISAEHGLASIFAAGGIATPEGVRVGSSAAKVKKAYPQLKQGPNASYAPLPGKPAASYGFLMAGGRVKSLTLDLQTQDCHN
ncbi:hypothetical protein [Actinomadura xylanilytica]|uniref:hypothetical protein n=1 Tax=Actinomadura xylanilytica TaxID=887459 RepID=UPI00255A9B11|nr:hypothetical protein [Actinomadura xylanilytica]MDL4773093.1 hypothetical protein [Actinomadura xylanilytica]